MLKIKKEVLFQKDYRIADDVSIFEYAISNMDAIDAAAPIAVVSVENSYMELNLSGAIIFECIENKEDLNKICSKFVKLFGLTNEKAKNSITAFFSKLLDKGVVEEMED